MLSCSVMLVFLGIPHTCTSWRLLELVDKLGVRSTVGCLNSCENLMPCGIHAAHTRKGDEVLLMFLELANACKCTMPLFRQDGILSTFSGFVARENMRDQYSYRLQKMQFCTADNWGSANDPVLST